MEIMRPIDADKLVKNAYSAVFMGRNSNRLKQLVMWIVDDLINTTPTIDAVPVVHGRWVNNGIPDSMLSGCSVCGCPYGSSGFRYCPHCGAKMDGDEE